MWLPSRHVQKPRGDGNKDVPILQYNALERFNQCMYLPYIEVNRLI